MSKIKPPIPLYNTVLSMIRKLKKGRFTEPLKIGKSHQYYPTITKVEGLNGLNIFKDTQSVIFE